tara:strand:+ start:689 stop:1699 length:1011 start_codon:yes stop_codon:yes gene_type:complete
MTTQSIPVINRSHPKFVFWLIAIPFYLILVPLNWIMNRLGKPGALINFVTKRQFNPARLTRVFENFSPDEGDVFVSTFAKSGTNWMMQIAHQIAWRGDGEFEHIHDAVSWPDGSGKRNQKTMIALDNEIVKKLSPTGMRIIKTHLSAHYVPYNERAKYLIVVRDPKEVFVSSYPFIGGVAGPLMPSIETWLEMFLTKDFPINFGNTWAEHTASYWALKDKPNVLILSYTQLKDDPRTGIQQVADTLGVNLTEQELAKVIEKSSFAYMKKISHKFNPMPENSLPWSKGFEMIREGKSGNSSELISRQQQMRIDAHFQDELRKLGCDFPYAEFCTITQ